MKWVNVYGPNITRPLGCDSLRIESEDAITIEAGVLSVESPAYEREGSDGYAQVVAARTHIYPEGEWYKIQIVHAEDET